MLSDIQVVYELLQKLPPAVTFFGGARIKEADPYYALGQEIGALLAAHGAPIRTGAGPGIMTAGPEGFKAALKNLPKNATDVDCATALHPVVSGMTDAVCAQTSGQKTQGFRIKLPFEQAWSDAIDVGAEAKLFPYRKLALYENSKGVAVFPGGYGTLDELFEVWAHGEVGMFNKPMAAVGTEFWSAILKPIANVAVEGGAGRSLIQASEWAKLFVTDSPADLVQHFEDAAPTTKAYDAPPAERAAALAREIDESIAVLDRLPSSVTFLGGRRLSDTDVTLKTAASVASSLAALGIPLRVGGAGVVAEAVCKGAGPNTDVQGVLLGGLEGTRELKNLTVHQSVEDVVTHKEIIGRKSQAFVALPGGLNTLGEVFSVLTQIQTGHLPKIPVVLVGKDYWQPIFDALKATMLSPSRQTISPHDLDLVTIVDDPKDALAALTPHVQAPAGSTSSSSMSSMSSMSSSKPMAAVPVFEGDHATMLNRAGITLASWLEGGVRGANKIAADVDFDPAVSRQFVVERVRPSLVQALEHGGVDLRHVAWALDHGVAATDVSALLKAGGGPAAFRFLYALAPMVAAVDIVDVAKDIVDRWSPKSETVFQRLIELGTSVHLQNPDRLDVWLRDLRSAGIVGDSAATLLGDAWDLVGAGHRIALETHALGKAHLMDLDEGVAYQHVRVLGGDLGPAVQRAAARLAEAPPSMKAVLHVDLRGNRHFRGLDDGALMALVDATGVFQSSRGRVQVLMDDRVLRLAD